MPIENNAYVAIAIIPIALVLVDDFKFHSISIPKSLSFTVIFIVASLVCQYIYTNQMTQLQRKTMNHIKKRRTEPTKNKKKRKSLIHLVDNRKSFDLTKWKSKNHPFANRYSSYSEKNSPLSKPYKRVNSWHGELLNSDNPLFPRERIALMIPSPPSSSQGETFENNLYSGDFRSSVLSTSSTIFENDNSRITIDSDSNIVDMSIDLNINSDGQDSSFFQPASQSKTKYIATYLYDRFRKSKAENSSYNKNCALDPSHLKPFNLTNRDIHDRSKY